MKTVNVTPGTQEWHDFRRSHIGASDIPIIMNVTPWKDKTRYGLWLEKTGKGSDFIKDSFAMARGRQLEEPARHKAQELLGVSLTPLVIQHDTIEFASASLDGISLDETIMVEIKCINQEDHLKTVLYEEIPIYYQYQLQWQLFCTGLSKMYYFSYQDESDYALVEVCRNDETIEMLLNAAAEFWGQVQSDEAPEIDENDVILIDDPLFSKLEEQYIIANEEHKKAKQALDILREQLIDFGDGLSFEGRRVSFTMVPAKEDYDYKAAALEYGVPKAILDKHKKKRSSYYKASIKKQKD